MSDRDPPELRCTRVVSNRHQRVLEAVRRHFRDTGASPSYREIEARCGVKKKAVRGSLDYWQRRGTLTFTPGKHHSIELVDRAAMLSDAEIELAVIGRGGHVTWSALPALADAFPVPTEDNVQAIYRRLLKSLP